MKRQSNVELAIFAGLVTAGVAVRLLLRDLPNFAPVAAIALFSGYFFRSRGVAALVPVAVMIISDLFLGFYGARMMALVYGALILPAVGSHFLRRRIGQAAPLTTGLSLATCSLAASLLFFATTNFGSWLWFDMYPHSWAGLWQCYAAAIPFFRYTLAGDALFAVTLFGSYAAMTVWHARTTRCTAIETEYCG